MSYRGTGEKRWRLFWSISGVGRITIRNLRRAYGSEDEMEVLSRVVEDLRSTGDLRPSNHWEPWVSKAALKKAFQDGSLQAMLDHPREAQRQNTVGHLIDEVERSLRDRRRRRYQAEERSDQRLILHLRRRYLGNQSGEKEPS
jgi:hypothetical protein